MSVPDSTKNPEQPQAPADPLKVDEVLTEELARLRPTFESIVPDPAARKPENEEEDVSPALAKKLFEQSLTALCLSGGGIRSASFCLGILQALAQRKLLSRFDYLSTVSGGGYIGSWLSAWRTRDGLAKVETSLAGSPEPKEITSLRDFASYLTPSRGLMSSDTWAGFATLIRNLVLNWTLFLPLVLLLVWIPKAAVLVFQLGQELGSPAFWLVTAAVLYFLSELFISRQMIEAEQQHGIFPKEQEGNSAKSLTFGAGQGSYLRFGLLPAYFAACLASIALEDVCPKGHDCWPLVSQYVSRHACQFIGAGAILWGLPFLLASLFVPLFKAPCGSPIPSSARKHRWDYPWLVAARVFSGAAFGVVMVLAVALLQYASQSQHDDRYVVVFGVSCFFLAHLAGSTLFAGLSTFVPDFDAVREWTARAGGWFLVSGLAWTVYASLVLWELPLPEGWSGELVNLLMASGGTLAGVASALFGHSTSTPAKEGQKSSSNKWNRVAVAGAVFFSVVAVFELSRAFDWAVLPDSLARLTKCHKLTSSDSSIPLGLIAPAILVAWAVLASSFINVNKFSLHTFYRNRLIRCYLGASNHDRRPNAFTGFDEGDNRKMSKLHRDKPFHVVNITLNLVHGKRLAWQERKATSFTVSPLAAGNPHLRYRRAEKYGDGITLGTAMAISGAAASPNMGYHSSPPLALLMTLFNVRLGWWLGNPALGAWNISGPRLAILPFIMELFGLTNDERRFVYLSDGGHFENLGIYEMLRRRCRTIVAVDAACDPQFEYGDLGNAIRKARIDFGVEVIFSQPFTPSPNRIATRLGLITNPKTPNPSPYCAIGRIRYPGISAEGTLIYIKAAIHGDEPEDTLSYAALCDTFPHESTLDQFFTESKFESYRRLGLHIGSAVFGRQHEDDLEAVDELVNLAAEHVQARAGAAAT